MCIRDRITALSENPNSNSNSNSIVVEGVARGMFLRAMHRQNILKLDVAVEIQVATSLLLSLGVKIRPSWLAATFRPDPIPDHVYEMYKKEKNKCYEGRDSVAVLQVEILGGERRMWNNALFGELFSSFNEKQSHDPGVDIVNSWSPFVHDKEIVRPFAAEFFKKQISSGLNLPDKELAGAKSSVSKILSAVDNRGNLYQARLSLTGIICLGGMILSLIHI